MSASNPTTQVRGRMVSKGPAALNLDTHALYVCSIDELEHDGSQLAEPKQPPGALAALGSKLAQTWGEVRQGGDGVEEGELDPRGGFRLDGETFADGVLEYGSAAVAVALQKVR